jgi:hypothetical protein
MACESPKVIKREVVVVQEVDYAVFRSITYFNFFEILGE